MFILILSVFSPSHLAALRSPKQPIRYGAKAGPHLNMNIFVFWKQRNEFQNVNSVIAVSMLAYEVQFSCEFIELNLDLAQ
jgi:hypothetical protein